MNVLAWIALFPLSLAAYAAASVLVLRVRKLTHRVSVVDVLVLLLLWSALAALAIAHVSARHALWMIGAAFIAGALLQGFGRGSALWAVGGSEFRPFEPEETPSGYWKRWVSFAGASGDFQARILLHLFYFIILGPFSLIVRGDDPLQRKAQRASTWTKRSETSGSLEEARRQG